VPGGASTIAAIGGSRVQHRDRPDVVAQARLADMVTTVAEPVEERGVGGNALHRRQTLVENGSPQPATRSRRPVHRSDATASNEVPLVAISTRSWPRTFTR
jgi:hypothetical protein